MRLKALEIRDVRNIPHLELEPDPGLTVVAGANGQGKTNLLESIFLLTGSKSFRGARDMDLVRRGQGRGLVTGLAEAEDRESRIEITIEGEKPPDPLGLVPAKGGRRGRFAQVNGVDYGRAGAIAGIFTAVVFEPNHLSLVKAGPEGRRRFLDAALCQLYPGYLAILRRFNKALTQKNALLRRYHEMADAAAMLDAFDAELAASGGEMTRRRAEYLDQAAPAAVRFYQELSRGAERLEIHFEPSAQAGGLAGLLLRKRETDIRAGYSTAGPQREDFEVLIDGTSARTFGSQGQQRSAVLSLKLAEAEVAKQVTGQHPVLLLDDVLSELDENRQSYLLGKMGVGQSFVSCCDAAAFSRTAGLVVRIQDGAIVKE